MQAPLWGDRVGVVEEAIEDAAVEARMTAQLEQALAEHQAPVEQYERLGLLQP